ncbi:AT-rich interactive domain-containing protein 2-like isoform X2 [Ipomoea triloba]|uniref:AT-rich interactive domain-containing protein 2-like isoform X2 n=1 Tax=Ipomoea triloba TaxID=35885 RepID=UPI00125E2341|nr:AT-rich interactive domain-containing protein 2-like isoform X2 [Ipomoea triloba]
MAGLKRRVEQGIVKGCSTVEPEKCLFGKYSDAEMLVQLRRIALDPCDPEVTLKNVGSLFSQTLRVREVLSLSQTDCPRRKRKLQQYVKEKLRSAPKLALEAFDQESEGKKSRKQLTHMSSVSSLLGSVKSTRSSQQKPISTSHSTKSLLTFEDSFQERTMVVPVGPRFQAEVPEWTVPLGNVRADSADGDSDDSRWLGTRVWPVEIDDTKLSTRSIGKGREESCNCQAPGSVDCVRRHVLEERLLLQCDLGPAFSTWKFDQMGEQMMKSWTVKEQQIFQPLVKIKPQTNGKNFLKHALKSIPSEYRTTVINFYFNVFLPGRIGMQTRMSSEVQVDTDDDEAGDSNYLHVPNRCHGKTGMPVKSNDVKKTRYLRVRT